MSSTQTLPTTKQSRKIPFILLFCLGMAVLLVKLLPLPLHEDVGGVGAMFDIVSLAPNSSVEEIETSISQPLEGLLSELDTVKHVYSASGQGKAMITVEFKLGLAQKEAFKVLQDHLSQHQATLPNAVNQAVITPLKATPALVFTLWSNTLSLPDFNEIVTQVKNSVCDMPIVTECEILTPSSIKIPPNSEMANNMAISVSITNGEGHDRNKETEAVVDKVNGLKTDLISQNVHIKTTRHDGQSQSSAQLITSLMHLWLDLLFTMLFIVLLVWLLVSWKTALMTLVFFPVMVASSISLFWFSEISVNALLTLSGLIAVLLSVIIFWFSGFRYLQALLRAIVFVMVSVLLFSLVINSYTNHIESLLTMETPQDIYIAIDLPENTQSEKTAKLTQKIGEELANIPEIISIQSYTGEVQQNSTRNKPWFADIDVTLDDTEIDTRSNKEVQQDIRNKITPLVQAADAKIQIIEGL